MDYSCAKFGDFSFMHFGFIVRTDRHTKWHTDADDRYTQLNSATPVTDFISTVKFAEI